MKKVLATATVSVLGVSQAFATSYAVSAPDLTDAQTSIMTVFAATLVVSALVFGFKQIRRIL